MNAQDWYNILADQLEDDTRKWGYICMLLRLVPGLLLLREGCLDPEPEELLADLTMIRGWLSEGAHVPLGSPVFLDDTKSITTHAVYMSISTHIAASLRLTSCRRRSTMPDWRLPVGVLRRREALRDACALDAADESWLVDPFLLMRECDTDGPSRFMIGRLKVSTDASGISSRITHRHGRASIGQVTCCPES